MEIERKWIVRGWPKDLPLIYEQSMRQGYLTVVPTVRIREEAMKGGKTEYVLCLKSGKGLVREEIELPLSRPHFDAIERMIGFPLIPKIRRTYGLPDGMKLEVNHVDEGKPTEFWYAEVEYETVSQAENWQPSTEELKDYLDHEVTGKPGQSMGAYWLATRSGEKTTEEEKKTCTD